VGRPRAEEHEVGADHRLGDAQRQHTEQQHGTLSG
jgi:hypothetical protein